MESTSSPIAAIATAPGRGGVGIVRVSGAGIAALIPALLGDGVALSPRHARYGAFRDATGEPIDQGLALWFPAPHSFTGEDVLELHGHGGPVVMQLLLRRVLEAGRALGLRLAEPGEFTRRAFLNDKLDLAQAEAVADLIDASTEQAARSAGRALAGAFSARIDALVAPLVELRALTEATLDFPDEEIDFLEAADARGRLARVRAALADVQREARRGALLRDGLTVVLAGAPNVGKSSLLNALAGAEVAIVTPIAGTTRDRVVERIQIEGVPLHIVDTAGLRETDDAVERIGIERTREAIAQADVVVRLEAAGSDSGGAVALPELPPGVPVLRVVNKIDLTGEAPGRVGAQGPESPQGDTVRVSAKTGAGLDALRATLLALAGWVDTGESGFIARERHLQALAAAAGHLETAQAHLDAPPPPPLELFAEELRLAHEALQTITGQFVADDLLGVIFGRFCIGK